MRSTAHDLDEIEQRVRFFVTQHLAGTGRAPSTEKIALKCGLSPQSVEEVLHRLQGAHAIVLAPGSTNVWMAPPFSAVPTSFPVETSDVRYWANCAWEMLSVSALLGVDSTSTTQCPDCADELTIRICGGELEPTETVVHFAVPAIRFWENIGFT